MVKIDDNRDYCTNGVTGVNTLLCEEPRNRQYYYYIFTSLFSLLLMLTIVQLASDNLQLLVKYYRMKV